jgi:hypothetical protein
MNHVMTFLLTNLNKTERLCHPLQIGCPNIIPGLRAQPFWDTSEFPWVKDLEASFPILLEEFLGMKEQGMLFQVCGRHSNSFVILNNLDSRIVLQDLDQQVGSAMTLVSLPRILMGVGMFAICICMEWMPVLRGTEHTVPIPQR